LTNSKSKVLILGSSGLLGKRLTTYLKNLGYIVFEPSRKIFKLEDPIKNIFDLIVNEKIKTVINLVANTNVDYCEQNPLQAYQSNVQTLEKFINTFYKTKVHLIHISSDQVYFGEGPHSEENPNPCNVYAITKYLSEFVALKTNATILRTNFTGKSFLKSRYSFSDWIVNSIVNQKQINLFSDIYFSPLSIENLCYYIDVVIKSEIRGVYNLGSRDSISKSDFGCELIRHLGLDLGLVTITKSDHFERKANRPKDMSLNVNKFEDHFQLVLPTIVETNNSIFQDYIIT